MVVAEKFQDVGLVVDKQDLERFHLVGIME
jgi:hypothetical protein